MVKYITYFLDRLCGPIRFGFASFVHGNWDGTASDLRVTLPVKDRLKSLGRKCAEQTLVAFDN